MCRPCQSRPRLRFQVSWLRDPNLSSNTHTRTRTVNVKSRVNKTNRSSPVHVVLHDVACATTQTNDRTSSSDVLFHTGYPDQCAFVPNDMRPHARKELNRLLFPCEHETQKTTKVVLVENSTPSVGSSYMVIQLKSLQLDTHT